MVSRDNYVPETEYEFLGSVRTDIVKIYNKKKTAFVNTPAYNDYLERREDIIEALSIMGSDERKQKVEEELQQYKKDHQVDIVANEAEKQQKLEEEVRLIVSVEGSRFEGIKEPIALVPHPPRNLKHPLEIQYCQFFKKEEETEDGAPPAEIPWPLDVKIKEHIDLPRRNFPTYDEYRAFELSGGYRNDVVQKRQMEELLHGI